MSHILHAQMAANVLEDLDKASDHDIHEKIAVLKTAANMLENKMSAAIIGSHVAQALKQ